jgi:hypothetical protein
LFKIRIEEDSIKCKNNLKNLTNLCILYGLNLLYKDSKACYECGYFGAKPYSEFIIEAIKFVNKEIRVVALNIVEAFGVSDMYL